MNPSSSRPVAVRIFHGPTSPAAGPFGRRLGEARAAQGERHRLAFLSAGAAEAVVVSDPPGPRSFGARLRDEVAAVVAAHGPNAGLVVLGSGALVLARPADLAEFVRVAGAGTRVALANNRYSADAVAIAQVGSLASPPNLETDNALPRWLAEAAGYAVADLAGRRRLGVDLDSPLDLLVAGLAAPDDADLAAAAATLGRVAEVATDRRAELLVAGRTSAATLAWLERHVAARVRALVEERGLRAAAAFTGSAAAAFTGSAAGAFGSAAAADDDPGHERRPVRRAASVLGQLLDRDGPAALGDRLAELADAAVVDLRVLLAHRFGRDEAAWPTPEDRFAADLLRPERIDDPWLRALVESAVGSPIPIALGGHTLVGPGLPRILRTTTRPAARPARAGR